MSLPVMTAFAVAGAIAFAFWYARNPAPIQDGIKRRMVSCKKCQTQIGLNNVKLDHEFSLRCDACHTRTIYKEADLIFR